MSDGLVKRAANILRKKRTAQEERLRDITGSGETKDDTSQRVQGDDFRSPPLPEGLMKTKAEGEAELKALRERQKRRAK